MRGARHAHSVLLALLAALASGCAGPLTRVDGGWHHARHGYTIGRPGGPGDTWYQVDVDGAVLAFQRATGETASLQTHCGRPVASAELMARHLVIGFRDRTLLGAGPVTVDGRSGWTQSFDTRGDGGEVRVKTVTLVAGDCTFDWILAAREPADAALPGFDAWWQGFRLDPERWGKIPG